MAGTVFSLKRGFAGTVSRSIDEIIEAFPNHGDTMEFGLPVSLDNDGGVVPFSGDLLGITVRIAKTNETYGKADYHYIGKEMVDVLKRGAVTVYVADGEPKAGGKVYWNGTAFSAVSGTELTNCKFKTAKDADGIAEIVVLVRAL